MQLGDTYPLKPSRVSTIGVSSKTAITYPSCTIEEETKPTKQFYLTIHIVTLTADFLRLTVPFLVETEPTTIG